MRVVTDDGPFDVSFYLPIDGCDVCTDGICDPTLIGAIGDVLAVKSASWTDVELEWSGDVNADSYSVWWVDDKELLPDAHFGTGFENPAGTCTPSPTTDCTHAGAVASPPAKVYYNIRGVCGGMEAGL